MSKKNLMSTQELIEAETCIEGCTVIYVGKNSIFARKFCDDDERDDIYPTRKFINFKKMQYNKQPFFGGPPFAIIRLNEQVGLTRINITDMDVKMWLVSSPE
jgi:hypothetical protein